MRKGLALLVLCGLTFAAWSAEPNKPNAKGRQPQPQAEQRGTEKAPVFVSGEVVAKKDRSETTDEKTEREKKTKGDEAVVEYTFVIAVCTLLLFVIAVIQALLFRRQLRLMRDGAEDARNVAVAARESADAVTAQTKLFIASESAHIFAEIALDFSSIDNGIPNEFRTVKADIFFRNYGKTPAVIQELRGLLWADENTPQALPTSVPFDRPLPQVIAIAAGDSYTLPVKRNFDADETGQIIRMEKSIYVAGRILYRTIHGAIGMTSFCWVVVYKKGESTLVPSRDSVLNN